MRKYYTAPIFVDISITNRCNMKCDYCYASSGPDEDKLNELTCNEFESLFDDLDKMRVHRISLSGGEPFIREDFFHILEKTQKYPFAKIINTNAILINDKIAKTLTNYMFDRICVTIDGSTPDVHDLMRGSGSFVKSIEGIKYLQKYNLPVSTLFTLNKHNVSDLIKTIELNGKLGIPYMTVMIVCPTGRASDGSSLVTKEEWYPVFLELSKMKKENRMPLKFRVVPPNEGSVFWHFYAPLEHYDRLDLLEVWNQNYKDIPLERELSCSAGIRSASVASNGDVYGCDLMTGIEEFKAGNLKNNSFFYIWNNSETFKSFRNISFNDLTGCCSSCEYLWCGGSCRSAAYNLNGSIYESDTSCFYCNKGGVI